MLLISTKFSVENFAPDNITLRIKGFLNLIKQQGYFSQEFDLHNHHIH